VSGSESRRGVVLAVTAYVIWGTYIYGVNSGQVVESSLGYFINPLVTVMLGVGALAGGIVTAAGAADDTSPVTSCARGTYPPS
jgi:EamA domain-containing membrane protein RarD